MEKAGGSVAEMASDPAAAPPALNPAASWGLVESARARAGDDTERRSELLEESRSKLPPRQIAGFQQIRRETDEQATRGTSGARPTS